MHPLQITLIISATSMLMIAALFFLIRTMPSRPGINWWLSAAFIKSLVCFYAFYYFGDDTSTAGIIFFYCHAMLVAQCLCIGTLLFAGVEININLRLLTFIITSVGIISLVLSKSFFIASLCFSLYNAAHLLYTSFKIVKVKDSKLSFKIPAVLMSLNALHWLDFPFLSQVEWFVPIGFMLGMSLLVGIFFSLAVLALLQFKAQTQDSEQAAIYAARTDSLTGLYNRNYLETLFNQYKQNTNFSDQTFSLLYFDLDGFKKINDTYGHSAGDMVLKKIAKRLKAELSDQGDAVRIGGDELIVFIRTSNHYDREMQTIKTKELLNCIELPINDDDKTYHISASIGGCCFGKPFNDLENMLNKADKLMYAAKQAGGKRIYFSKPTQIADTDLLTKASEEKLSNTLDLIPKHSQLNRIIREND